MQSHPFVREWYHHCPNCQSPLRQEATAAHCDNCGFYFYLNPAPTVVVIIEKDGRVLLAQRGIEPKKNLWNLVGGFVNYDESPEEAVYREVEEETNLKVEIVAQLGPAVPDVYSEKQDPTLNFIYLVKIVSGELQAMDDVAATKWATLDEVDMDSLAFENDRVALKRYKEYTKEHYE